ncbi:MAG: hypothetical protein AAGD06_19050 [Acidobacteriota bacterium]
MGDVFSVHIRAIGGSRDGDPVDIAEVLESLRRVLTRELKKRSLWNAPPRYLGVIGGQRWTDEGVLEELVLDCYGYIFLHRLPGLLQQSKRRPRLAGLVLRNVQNFLHDRQRRHDPLGFRIFEIAQAAVLSLVEDEVLFILEGNPKIRNETVLGFTPWNDAGGGAEAGALLARELGVWIEELMPELVTAWRREASAQRLARRVAGLPKAGVDAFVFGDLVEPLKQDARGRWMALVAEDLGEVAWVEDDDGATLMRLVAPCRELEERQRFSYLLDCLGQGVEAAGRTEKTRRHLKRLLRFLQHWSAEAPIPSDLPEAEAAELDARDPHRLPPDQRLGPILDIPRNRLPELRATLGDLVRDCGGLPANALGSSAETYGSAGGITAEDRRAVLAQRREALGEAVMRLARELPPAPEGPHRAGDLFLLQAPSPWFGSWLLLDDKPSDAGDSLRLLPLDVHPLVGSRDLPLGPHCEVARCGHGIEVPPSVLDRGLPVGRLDDGALSRVQDREVALGGDDLPLSAFALDIDDSPEYRAWIRDLGEARGSLTAGGPRRLPAPGSDASEGAAPPARASAPPETSGPTGGRPRGRGPSPRYLGYAMAAALGGLVLGLGVRWPTIREPVSIQLRPQNVVPPEIVLGERVRGGEPINIDQWEDSGLLYLYMGSALLERPETLSLRILGAAEAVLWSAELPKREAQILEMPTGALEPGAYVLLLVGVDGDGGEEVLEENILRITDSAPPQP